MRFLVLIFLSLLLTGRLTAQVPVASATMGVVGMAATQQQSAVQQPQGVQQPSTQQQGAWATENADSTIYEKWLPEVIISEKGLTEEEKAARRRLIYNVRRAYPYAVLAAEKLSELERLKAEAKRRKDRKKAMKDAEERIRAEFEEDLKSMTISQGKILFKLIYRQTEKPSYHLVKEFRGGWTAFSFQFLARFWGYNLKKKYDPANDKEDAIIEMVVERIESGELAPIEIRKNYVPPPKQLDGKKSTKSVYAPASKKQIKKSKKKK